MKIHFILTILAVAAIPLQGFSKPCVPATRSTVKTLSSGAQKIAAKVDPLNAFVGTFEVRPTGRQPCNYKSARIEWTPEKTGLAVKLSPSDVPYTILFLNEKRDEKEHEELEKFIGGETKTIKSDTRLDQNGRTLTTTYQEKSKASVGRAGILISGSSSRDFNAKLKMMKDDTIELQVSDVSKESGRLLIFFGNSEKSEKKYQCQLFRKK